MTKPDRSNFREGEHEWELREQQRQHSESLHGECGQRRDGHPSSPAGAAAAAPDPSRGGPSADGLQ